MGGKEIDPIDNEYYCNNGCCFILDDLFSYACAASEIYVRSSVFFYLFAGNRMQGHINLDYMQYE